MRQLVIFRIFTQEEARLAHVEVEALQATVSEAYDRIFLADVALRLVLGCFGSC